MIMRTRRRAVPAFITVTGNTHMGVHPIWFIRPCLVPAGAYHRAHALFRYTKLRRFLGRDDTDAAAFALQMSLSCCVSVDALFHRLSHKLYNATLEKETLH